MRTFESDGLGTGDVCRLCRWRRAYHNTPGFTCPEALANTKQLGVVPGAVIFRDKQVGGTHYKDMGVQPWDVVDTWPLEQRIGYYRGGALKYIMRMGSKDESAQEIAKGMHYIEKLLEVLRSSQPQPGDVKRAQVDADPQPGSTSTAPPEPGPTGRR